MKYEGTLPDKVIRFHKMCTIRVNILLTVYYGTYTVVAYAEWRNNGLVNISRVPEYLKGGFS